MHTDPKDPRDGGFTLVELLVVVIVIGVLAAIAVPTYLQVRDEGYVASVTADMRQVQIALEEVAVRDGGSFARLDGVTEVSAELLDEGYNGSAETLIAVQADDDGYCVQGTDVRLDGRLLVIRAGLPGIDTDSLGCTP